MLNCTDRWRCILTETKNIVSRRKTMDGALKKRKLHYASPKLIECSIRKMNCEHLHRNIMK